MELPKNRCWISRLGAWQKGLMSRSSVGIQEPTGGGGKPWEWMAETQWSRPVWESEPRAQRGLRLSPLLAFSRRNIRFHKNVVDHFSSLCVGGTGKTQLEMPFCSRLHSALFCSSFLRVPSFRPDPASCLINQYQGGQLVYFFLPFHFLEFCWSLSYSFSFPIKLLKDTMEMLISCISIKPVFEPIMFREENRAEVLTENTPRTQLPHPSNQVLPKRLKVTLKWASEMLFWEPGTWHSCGGKTCPVGALTCLQRALHFPFLIGESEWLSPEKQMIQKHEGVFLKSIQKEHFFLICVTGVPLRRCPKDWNCLSLLFSPPSWRIRGVHD